MYVSVNSVISLSPSFYKASYSVLDHSIKYTKWEKIVNKEMILMKKHINK